MGIKRHKVMYEDTAAGTGSWIALDTRYEESPTRAIRVNLVSGDTFELQGIVKDVKGIDKSFLDELTTEDITSIKTYTESESDILEGNWTYIRAIKVGTAGNGLIEGFI